MHTGQILGLVTIAAVTTVLGGILPFAMGARMMRPTLYAMSLSLAAGVMVFVCVELFTEALPTVQTGLHRDSWSDAKCDALGWLFVILVFAAGWLIAVAVDSLVHRHTNICQHDHTTGGCSSAVALELHPTDSTTEISAVGTAAPAAGNMYGWKTSMETLPLANKIVAKISNSYSGFQETAPLQISQMHGHAQNVKSGAATLGLITALCVSTHNLPEGFGTFVSSSASEALGASLCFAIALHNLPLGYVIALPFASSIEKLTKDPSTTATTSTKPIFWTTGEFWHAILLTSLSGASLLFGALLGWVVLKTSGLNGEDLDESIILGLCNALTSGIVANVAIAELLITAVGHDPNNRVTGMGFFLGLLIMGICTVIITSLGVEV